MLFHLNRKHCKFIRSPTTEGQYDQLVMKAPRKLKEDVSNKFPYLFLEKNVNKNKFESYYETKPQLAVAGTKHTITNDTNKIIHRKRVSKTLTHTFKDPFSRRGQNPRGPDGRFTQMRIDQLDQSDEIEQPARESTPVLEESMLETVLNETPMETSPVYGKGKKKLIRDRSVQQQSPVQSNLRMHLENMTEEQLEEARGTAEGNPDTIPVVDRNGNTDSMKIEQIENINTIYENEPAIRKSTRIKTTNPILRYGNPIPH